MTEERPPDNPYADLTDEELLAQCDVETRRGSGPGGQHRNKVETAVRLHHRPTGLTVSAAERRSQRANLEVAVERLRERLARHFHRDPPRRKTRKPRSVRRREVDEKRKRGETKRLRRRPSDAD